MFCNGLQSFLNALEIILGENRSECIVILLFLLYMSHANGAPFLVLKDLLNSLYASALGATSTGTADASSTECYPLQPSASHITVRSASTAVR